MARYRPDEVRFSVSWKAYCYRDEAERRGWSLDDTARISAANATAALPRLAGLW